MDLELIDGWVSAATKRWSPNQDLRPPEERLELVVIHGISLPPDAFGGSAIEKFFCNQLDPLEHPYYQEIAHLRVSAHFLIQRTGALFQFVSTERRAWHAGVSTFLGRSACNDFSIGIELEGSDRVPYADAQYDALIPLLACLRYHYPLLRDQTRLVGHSDIAPMRKTDPGPFFDWARVRKALRK